MTKVHVRALAIAVAIACLPYGISGQGNEAAASGATPVLVTDRSDYSPGDTVSLSGKHLVPSAPYTIVITLPDQQTTRTLNATADSGGNFVATYLLDGQQGDHHAALYDAAGNQLAEAEFHDSHFRYGHLTWRQIGPNTAAFTLVNAFRRGYSGSGPDGLVVTGDTFTEDIGGTALCFGDWSCTGTLTYEVIAFDAAQNWVIGRAISPGGLMPLPGSGVTVSESEPNDTLAQANEMNLGDNYAATISPSWEADYVTFTLSATSVVEASTVLQGLGDSVMTLYDGNGSSIAYNDDSNGTLASQIIRTLAPGTYYVAVRSYASAYSGAYTLQLRTSAVQPPGPLTHSYTSAGPFTAYIDSCCRIGELQNYNDSYRVETSVRFDIANSSPVSSLPPIVNVPVNTPGFSFLLPAVDAEGDQIGFRAASAAESQIWNPIGPAGAYDAPNPITIDPATGIVSWNTTGTVSGGLYAAQFVLEEKRDSVAIGKSAVDFILRVVNSAGTAPVCSLSPATTAYEVAPGQPIVFTVTGSDVDLGNTITLNSGGVPPGATLTPGLPLTATGAASATFNWTPAANQVGTAHAVSFTVTDSTGLAAQCSVTINVTAESANQAPSVDAGTDQTAEALSFALQASGSDPDGDTLSYSWSLVSGPGSFSATGATPIFTPASAPAVYVLQVTVDDGRGGTASDTVTIDALSAPPVATAVTTPPAGSGGWNTTDVQVAISATDAGGSGVQSVSYSLSGASAGAATIAGAGAALTITAEGETTVTYYATDNVGNVSAPQTVVVRIDRTAPTLTCSSAGALWPPNHRMVGVTASVAVDGGASGSLGFVLLSASSNEPDDDLGDGRFTGDIQGFVVGTPDTSGFVRAERSGTGTGRVYTLTYQGSDGAGNTATCAVVVARVPHDQR